MQIALPLVVFYFSSYSSVPKLTCVNNQQSTSLAKKSGLSASKGPQNLRSDYEKQHFSTDTNGDYQDCPTTLVPMDTTLDMLKSGLRSPKGIELEILPRYLV